MAQFAVIGLGRFGSRLAATLAAEGAEVLGIDRDETVIEHMRDRLTLAVALDATDEQALRHQGVASLDAAVVGIGAEFEATVLCTVVLKHLGVPRVIARAGSARAAEILERIGADAVVNPEDEAADRWANRLLTPRFLSQYELEPGYSIVELQPPKRWLGHTLSELDLRRQEGLHVVAIKRRHEGDSEQARPSVQLPSPAHPLGADDVLVLLGEDTALQRVAEQG
jgi:trk system potassium uptake protein TrkA